MPYSALLGRGAWTGRVGMRMEANHADVHHARAFHGPRDPQCQGFSQSRGGFPGALRETWCQGKGRLSHDGADDVVAIVDAPDDVTMNAILYSMGSLGNVRTETLRAFTRQETDQALAQIS